MITLSDSPVATAETSVRPVSIASHSAVDADMPPPVESVLPGVFEADDAELNFVAEEACNEGELDQRACAMTADQVHALLPDVKAQIDEFEGLVATLPEVRAMAAEPRSVANVGSILSVISKASKNKAVQKLSTRANSFADYAARTQTAGESLVENNVQKYATAAIYLTASLAPPVGDMISLSEAIATGNVEQGIVATLSMTAAAVGLFCAPAGAVMAAGLAIYNLGKFLWNYFRAKPRDWIKEPPGTVEELFDSGADLQWLDHQPDGKVANAVFSVGERTAVQTLLLDSKWTKYNRDRKPVKYTIPAKSPANFFAGAFHTGTGVSFPAPLQRVTVTMWQGGKRSTANCDSVTEFGDTEFYCSKLSSPMTISLGRSAVLQLEYDLGFALRAKDVDKVCKGSTMCLFDSASALSVLSEGTARVRVVPRSFGLAGDRTAGRSMIFGVSW